MPTSRALRPPPLGQLRRPRLRRVFERERLFADIDAAAAAPGCWIAGPPGRRASSRRPSSPPTCRPPPRPASGCNSTPATPTPRPSSTFFSPPWRWSCRGLGGKGRRRPPTTCVTSRPTCAACSGAWLRCSSRPGRWCSTTPRSWARRPPSTRRWPPCWPSCPSARVFFISREPPPPAYARALAGQQLALVDERQLRFSAQDT